MTRRDVTVPLDEVRRDQVVLCAGGPLTSQAFFAGDLADRQRACERTRNAHTPLVATGVLHYRPTDRDATREVRARKGVHYQARVVTHRPLEVVR